VWLDSELKKYENLQCTMNRARISGYKRNIEKGSSPNSKRELNVKIPPISPYRLGQLINSGVVDIFRYFSLLIHSVVVRRTERNEQELKQQCCALYFEGCNPVDSFGFN
jgi:hypothetical protein